MGEELKSRLAGYEKRVDIKSAGKVLRCGDGVAHVAGLAGCRLGELVEFAGGAFAIAMNLEEDEVGCVLLSSDASVSAGETAYGTGQVLSVPCGDALLGRVVNPLGQPLDEGGPVHAEAFRPIEAPAPGILQRQGVNAPLQTGLMCVDSMVAIGRGQRELIIGDRQTGKTSIAIDAILNQKDTGVLCVYVAIGQKASSVARIIHQLKERGAMAYTCVVCATAADSETMQYAAPYAGCAMAEHFMYSGRDALIVYDDLTRHATAYRAMSLLIRRPPGREAYPGDVFYLHSRLLERAAQLSDDLGGGSMTALPIVETQAGDVSAYIPTNVISITDGQIYLESGLFFSGQRPAVNVGLSVSRVGGDAQTKAMKQSAGSLRIDLAQFREMEAFTQFSSDLDEATKRQLAYGQSLMRLLRQEQYKPFPQHSMVILLIAALNHTMDGVPLDELPAYRAALLADVEGRCNGVCRHIDRNGRLTDRDRRHLLTAAKEFAERWQTRGAAADGGEEAPDAGR